MKMKKVLLNAMSIITAFALAIPIALFGMPTQEVLAKNKEDYRMSQNAQDLVKECKDYWQEWGYDKAYSVELDKTGVVKMDTSWCFYVDVNKKGNRVPFKDRLDGKKTCVEVTSSNGNSSWICSTKGNPSSYSKKVVMNGEPLSTATHYWKIDNAVHAGPKDYDLIVVVGSNHSNDDDHGCSPRLYCNKERLGFNFGGFAGDYADFARMTFKLWVAEHTSDYKIGNLVNWTGLIGWDDIDYGERIDTYTPMHAYSKTNNSANAYVVGEETYLQKTDSWETFNTRNIFRSHRNNDNSFIKKTDGRWTMKGLDYYANWCFFAKVNIPTSGFVMSYLTSTGLGGGLASSAVVGMLDEKHSVRCIDKDKSSGNVLGEQPSSGDIYHLGDSVSGSFWGTSSPYSGYTYDSCTSIVVSGLDDIVYRYFKQGGSSTPPPPTPPPHTPVITDETKTTHTSQDYYYYVYYYSNGGSGSVASQSAYNTSLLE